MTFTDTKKVEIWSFIKVKILIRLRPKMPISYKKFRIPQKVPDPTRSESPRLRSSPFRAFFQVSAVMGWREKGLIYIFLGSGGGKIAHKNPVLRLQSIRRNNFTLA
jgi:hypothetical protein